LIRVRGGSTPRQDHIRWHLFGGTNGSGFLSEDGTKVTITSPEAVETTQWLVDLVQRHRIATTERVSAQIEVHFQTGQGLFEAQGSYRIPLWRQSQLDFGVLPMPVKKTPSTYSASHYGGVFKQANEDRVIGAIKLLLWATKPSVNARFCREDGWNPMFGATARDPLITRWIAEDPMQKVFVDVTPTARNVAVLPNQSAFYAPFNNAFRAMFAGQMGVSEGLTTAARQMQVVLDDVLSRAK
jgi:ABC-type glycerol-3-phosphate transport system substrate-binding protein